MKNIDTKGFRTNINKRYVNNNTSTPKYLKTKAIKEINFVLAGVKMLKGNEQLSMLGNQF